MTNKMQKAKWPLALIGLALLMSGCASGPVSRAEAEARLTQIAYDTAATATAQAETAAARITQVHLQSVSAANSATQAAALREMVAVTGTLEALPLELGKRELENQNAAEDLRQRTEIFGWATSLCGLGIGGILIVALALFGSHWHYKLKARREHEQRMMELAYRVEVQAQLPAPVSVEIAPFTLAQKWRTAVQVACAWGAEIGWTEQAWNERGVTYFAGTGKPDDQGRRRLLEVLDAMGITATKGQGQKRTWANGWSAATWERLMPTTPLPAQLPEVEPPALKIPLRSSEVPKFSELPSRGEAQYEAV